MTVYKKEDIPDRYHLKHHYRVPPLLLLSDDGYAIVFVSTETVTGLRLYYSSWLARLLSFKRPLVISLVCLCVCVSETLMLK